MADTKISGLPASSTPLAGTEVLPIVQSGSTVQVSVANLTAGRAVATGALTVTGALSATGTLSGGTSGTGYSFSGSAPATSLTLDASGNVGIGISSPVTRLEAGDTSDVAIGMRNSSSVTSGNRGTLSMFNSSISTVGLIRFGAVADNVGTDIQFGIRPAAGSLNSTAMILDSTGNLGIGVTSPIEKLNVGATSDVGIAMNNSTSVTSGNRGTISMNNSAGSTVGLIRFGAVTDNVGTDIQFFTRPAAGSLTKTMDISSSGIVTMSAYGAGAATFSAAGVISSVSDETWKRKDGVPTDPDAMLKKLEPGYWYYNEEKKESFGSDRQLGFYAQNVNAAIGPEAAPTPEEGKPWGYYDRSVLAITVMSLQKALATIETLTARVAQLESKA